MMSGPAPPTGSHLPLFTWVEMKVTAPSDSGPFCSSAVTDMRRGGSENIRPAQKVMV